MGYRLSHAALRRRSKPSGGGAHAASLVARCISEQAKLESGVEIHPAAIIGQRFVVDHGIGTVIGATAVIGEDCYLLQGGVVGSCGIASNPRGKRHPTIGNRVEIGAFARLLGPIVIGDDVLIGPHCVLTDSVPAEGRVVIRNQIQVCQGSGGIEVFGLIPRPNGMLEIHGRGLSGVRVELVTEDHRPLSGAAVVLVRASVDRLDCYVDGAGSGQCARIRISNSADTVTLLRCPLPCLTTRDGSAAPAESAT